MPEPLKADLSPAEPYFRIVKHRNEPCRFGLDTEDVEPFLKEHAVILINA